MNTDGGRGPGSSGTQRSVAELLAAYGAETRREGPGRSDPEARRRRAAVVDRPEPAAPPERAAPERAVPERPVPERADPDRTPAPRAAHTGRTSVVVTHVAATPARPATSPPEASPATDAIPVQGAGDDAETGAFAVSPAARAQMMPDRTDERPVPRSEPAPRGGTATLRRAEPPAGLGRSTGSDRDEHLDDDDLDDGYDGYGDDHGDEDDAPAYENRGYDDRGYDEPERAGAREWVSFGVQVVLGAILGAVLWTAFSYLWKYLPPVALVLALVSTTGLVFGVRAMRRSDDLKTTILAVVVGLLVTVTPAMVVLLLSPTG